MPRLLPPAERDAVLAALEARYGETTTELVFRNPFELLIAVILSAQSTDKQVNLVTKPLFERLPNAAAIAALEPEAFKPHIASIGLTNAKAQNIVATCRLLIERHGGEVPGTFEELVALPGVGRKTANVVLSVAFGVPAIPVDTHVFRVSNRLGLADSPNVDGTEAQLQKQIPREKWAEAHHWLIWHGRKICKAPTPKCEECFLTAWCRYFNRTGQWKVAAKPKAAKATPAPAKKAPKPKA